MNHPSAPAPAIGSPASVVIVGAGHAGATLVGLLRQRGYQGSIVLLGAEDHIPYHRPPLSKKFLGEDYRQELRPADFYRDSDIELRCGATVSSIDVGGHKVTVSDGSVIDYDALVLATGARARKLTTPGADLDGVLSLRSLPDAAKLRAGLLRGGHLVVVGGGYIGLEVAAEARSHSIPVTVLEREQRVLARVASPQFSELLTRHHEARGTQIRTGVDVMAFHGANGRVNEVALGDGSTLGCDVVLVGVGAIPNEELAVAAGIACDGGILVDNSAQTSAPDVYAIGDVTRRPAVGGRIRFESIPSAVEQAKQVAAVLLGADPPALEVPWFWSDQFDLKLKIAGVQSDTDTVVCRGNPQSGKFALFHLNSDNVVVAAETANSPGPFMASKKFIGDQVAVDPVQLSDDAVDLRHCEVIP
jgi:3-phenylpropionate/trans-cinnamate dioxygenase ferredoxin reductase subunit